MWWEWAWEVTCVVGVIALAVWLLRDEKREAVEFKALMKDLERP